MSWTLITNVYCCQILPGSWRFSSVTSWSYWLRRGSLAKAVTMPWPSSLKWYPGSRRRTPTIASHSGSLIKVRWYSLEKCAWVSETYFSVGLTRKVFAHSRTQWCVSLRCPPVACETLQLCVYVCHMCQCTDVCTLDSPEEGQDKGSLIFPYLKLCLCGWIQWKSYPHT